MHFCHGGFAREVNVERFKSSWRLHFWYVCIYMYVLVCMCLPAVPPVYNVVLFNGMQNETFHHGSFASTYATEVLPGRLAWSVLNINVGSILGMCVHCSALYCSDRPTGQSLVHIALRLTDRSLVCITLRPTDRASIVCRWPHSHGGGVSEGENE